MDVKHFISRLNPIIAGRVKDHKLQVTRDNLPTSVDFLVISPDFADLSRVERIDFLVSVVKDALGYVPTRISGVALTPEEANKLGSRPDDDDSEPEYLGSDDSAAMPASHD